MREDEILLNEFIARKCEEFVEGDQNIVNLLKDVYITGFQDGKNEMCLIMEKLIDDEFDI